jgi:hypothetical protein
MDAENRMEDMGQTLEAQVKAFFDSAPPLHNSHEITQELNQFIQRNSSSSGALASHSNLHISFRVASILNDLCGFWDLRKWGS